MGVSVLRMMTSDVKTDKLFTLILIGVHGAASKYESVISTDLPTLQMIPDLFENRLVVFMSQASGDYGKPNG